MADNNNNRQNKQNNGFRITSILYILLFIGFGYILFKDDGTELNGTATYTEFKEYMEKGYRGTIRAMNEAEQRLNELFNDDILFLQELIILFLAFSLLLLSAISVVVCSMFTV